MIEAQDIVNGLGGEWKGNAGLAPCPICQPEGRKDQRALSVKNSDGRTLLTCHKGGCKALDILDECKERGIIKGSGLSVQRSQADIERACNERLQKAASKQRYVDDIYSQSVPITNTPAQTYLETRGIIGIQGQKMRKTLRFHPELYHGPSKQKLPAMVARIRGPKGQPMGIHRTYLKPDGSGKAEVEGAKMMLGAASGGAVHFGKDNRVIAIAEGIETALSLSMASRLTVWACLSTSGMKGLILPPMPTAEVIVIAADNDDAGLAVAEITAERFEVEGRAVSIIIPQSKGADFNDVLRGSIHE